MRFLGMSLVLVAAMFTITACNSKSSSSSDQSSATATTEASAAAESSPGSEASPEDTSGAEASAAPTTAANEIPTYPGATTQASGSSSNMSGSAAGSVMSSDDSFDKVYTWYQQHMPAGSEKSHMTSPVESAVFTIGDPGSGQTSVTITTQGAKTMITVAKVKM